MENDKVIYAVKNNGVYEDLFDEVMVWLDSMCDVGTVKANFRGGYMIIYPNYLFHTIDMTQTDLSVSL